MDIALMLLMDNQHEHPNLKKWLLICLSNVWENNEDVRWLATRNAVYEKLYTQLEDPVPEVRAAAVYALGTFINSITQRNEHANEIDLNIVSTLIQKLFYDCSPLVRKELLVALHWFIIIFETTFMANYRKRAFEEHIKKQTAKINNAQEHSPHNSLISGQQSILSIVANQSYNGKWTVMYSLMHILIAIAIAAELAICNGSPTSTSMRHASSRDRLSNTSASKLLSVPVFITVPTNLSNGLCCSLIDLF